MSTSPTEPISDGYCERPVWGMRTLPQPRLSARFSIAANVKTHPDHLVLRVGLAVTRGSRFSSRSASGRLMMG
jgi:hypothetical protein